MTSKILKCIIGARDKKHSNFAGNELRDCVVADWKQSSSFSRNRSAATVLLYQ